MEAFVKYLKKIRTDLYLVVKTILLATAKIKLTNFLLNS